MSRSPRCLCLVLLAGATLAQAGPAPTPGAVRDTLPRSEPAVVRPTPPPVETAPEAPRASNAPSERAVRVDRFDITGNQAIPTAELEAHLVNWVGRSLTILQLFEAADALTAYYRARGFLIANVVVPAQKVGTGVVRLEVIEGRIGSVRIEGAEAYDEQVLLDGLHGLEPGTVLRGDVLEREVLLLNDRPGLAARAVIQPGIEYGTSDLILRVREEPWSLNFTLDNHGRDVIGEHRLLTDLAINSLTGKGDKLALSYLHAEDGLLKYLSAAYTLPLTGRGGSVTFSANRADYAVAGAAFAALGISGDTANYRIDSALPLRRGRYANTVLNLAVVRSTSASEVAAVGLTTATAINFLEVGAFWNRIDPEDLSSWTFSTTWAGNLKAQDVPPADAVGIDPAAMRTRLKVDATMTKPFGGRWAFITRFSGQWTPEALPDTQKFSLGGPYQLRGYESSEVRGDTGASLGFELQRAGLIGRMPWAFSLFASTGFVSSEDLVVSNTPVPGTSTDLQSGGIGLLFNPDGRFSVHLQYGKPLGDYVSPSGDDGRLWATIGMKF